MAYANVSELEEYTGQDAPDDAERLLERASELIDYYTLNNIDEDDSDHMEAAQKAVCAQVEYWEELGDEHGIMVMLRQISIGSFSATAGQQDGQSQIPELAPRAQQALFMKGLLSRGVSMT